MAEDKMLQKKLQKFSEEIMNIARSECSTIEQQLESDLEKQREELKASAGSDAARFLEAETREIDAASRAAAFAEKEKLRRELFTIREKYKDTVFAQAADRLREFTSGPDYESFLRDRAVGAGPDELAGCTILLREEDMKYAPRLTALFDGAAAESTGEIRLGGLILLSADRRRRIDLSLDSALQDQQEWFFSNSRLDITL